MFVLHMNIQLCSICGKDHPFLFELPWHLCWKPIGCTCVYICSFDSGPWICMSISIQVKEILKSDSLSLPSLFFFVKIVFNYSRFFQFLHIFRINLSISMNQPIRIWLGLPISTNKTTDQFGEISLGESIWGEY